MQYLFSPAIKLMQRLRLFPKFLIVAVLFSIPVIFITGLLINELNKSISFVEQEKLGVLQMRTVQSILQLTQQHRALRRLGLAGNATAQQAAGKVQEDITSKLAAFDSLQKKLAIPGTQAAVDEVMQSWTALLGKLATEKSKESYASDSAVIERLYKLAALISDRTKLSLDPEVDSYYLVGLFAKSLPELADEISDIAGRGAPYIDTGLLEPNEDVLINADVMLAKRDIARIPVQLEAMYRENPGFKDKLRDQQAALPMSLEFLERTKNEVLNTLNQTSGTEFLASGSKSVSALYAYADVIANLLDSTLDARLSRDVARRNMILLASFLGLILSTYLIAGFYLSFSDEVRELSKAVESVAGGDLSRPIRSSGNDEIAQLLNAFDGMRTGLASLVANIREGTEAIAGASNEMAQGNADLSARTEQQAASLEETSASMDALTITVKQNAASAEHANQSAASAKIVAFDGGVAVAKVIDTMGVIQQFSKKISDIIGVIDGIAFQTNILALNAAVEAARAGEQGRGFAVVAAEVRNLAQRSANAAKEIKVLITTSVEQIGVGSQQVDSAGNTMQQLVSSIQAVTDTMQEIASASKEQWAGIEQLGGALGQMDAITQQNAALVEQAAAASESMHDQAVKLARAVEVFKIADAVAVEGRAIVRAASPVSHGNPPRIYAANDAASNRRKMR